MPVAVAPADDGRDRERGDGVAGGKASAAAHQRAAAFEPGIPIITFGRDRGGTHAASRVLEKRCQYLGVGHGLARQQGRRLHLGIMAYASGQVERNGSGYATDDSGVAREDPVEPVKRGTARATPLSSVA